MVHVQVFSFFEYSSQCSKRTLRLPMEPLVGMMRHPFVIPICRPEVRLLCRMLTPLLQATQTALKPASAHS